MMSNVIPFPAAEPTSVPTPEFYHCGICESYHPVDWDGDCRDDANRFMPDQLDEKYGDNGWTETLMPGLDLDEYIELIEQTHGVTVTDREAFRERFESRTPYECDPEYDNFDRNNLPYRKN